MTDHAFLDDDLGLAPEDDASPAVTATDAAPHWKLLVVDDEPDIHAVTELALRGFTYDGQPLQILHAHSGREAVDFLRTQPDIAIVLMDVIMETERAGLDAVHAIRVELGNRLVRLVLRTGQPGQAPESEVVTAYDINDYKEKSELTARKLFTTVHTGLNHYRQLLTVEAHRHELEKVVDELRRSNRDLSEFAFIASHDLSTPLRSLVGFSQLLEKRYSDVLDGEAREFLDFIVQTTRRMKAQIDNLLTVSQTGARVPTTAVNLDDCIRQARWVLRGPILSSGADLRVQDGLPVIDGVATEMVQVFTNLLGNAIKFRRPDRAPEIGVGATFAGPGRCEIRITDNGIGVEPSLRPQLFQPLRRLHHPHEYEGGGVGLAICRKIVEARGGSIRLEDGLLGGLSVVLTLPTRPAGELLRRGGPVAGNGGVEDAA